MASQGPLSPVTIVSDPTIGVVPWTNPGNAASSNDVYATVSVGAGVVISEYLKATNFITPTPFSIPADAILVSIVLEIERKASSDDKLVDNALRLVIAGAIDSQDKSSGTNWTTTEAYFTYTWTTGLPTPTQCNASNFGFALSIKWLASAAPTASVDHMRATINYNAIESGASVSCMGM